MLAKHIAHLFIRDALVTYDDYAEKDDMQSSEHGKVFDGNHLLLVVLLKHGV